MFNNLTDSQTKICQKCADEIPLSETVCKTCGAQFEITNSGYCQNCHEIRETDTYGQCKICGTRVVDWHTVSKLKEIPTPLLESVPPKPAVTAADTATELMVLPIKGAGVVLRLSALSIDILLISLLIFGLMTMLLLAGNQFTGLGDRPEPQALWRLYSAVALPLIPATWFLYFIILEAAFGTTPGKASSSLRVIKKGGGRISLGQAIVRALFNPLDILIGAFLIGFTPLKQRLGDLLAGTLVVHKEKIHRAEFRPPALTLEFHDYRQVKFAEITQGIVYKFGMIRQLVLRGLSVDKKPLKLTIYGHFFRPEFDMLRLNLERRYNLKFPEKIILWRLFLIILLLVIGALAVFLALKLPTIQMPAESIPVVIATSTPRPSATPRPTATKIPPPTSTPLPLEVTFDTIGNYPTGRSVILVGRLALMSSTRCSARTCGLLLENPAKPSQDMTIFVTIGSEPNMMKPLPDSYTKSDIQVRLNDGTLAVVGHRIRVTGKVCSTTGNEPCITDIVKIELFQVK
jgi:uncharacterized RDD family membrane protein YckC